MMDLFFLLTAYYIIKPVREALILGGAGAEIRSYAGAGQAVLFWLMLVAAGVLAICLALTTVIHRRESNGNPRRAQMAARTIGSSGGFQLVLRERYLLMIAVLVFLANLVNTTGEFILG